MLNYLDSTLNKFKLKINAKKTKEMVISKRYDQSMTVNIKLKNETIEQVQEFCYLGSLITQENNSKKEIRRRIALAKHAFEKKRTLLTNKNLSIRIRKKLIRTYIWS